MNEEDKSGEENEDENADISEGKEDHGWKRYDSIVTEAMNL